MDDDVLDIGPRRSRPWLRLLAVLAVVGAVVAFLLTRGGGGADHASAPTSTKPAVTPSVPLPASQHALSVANLPPWPERDGACGNSAFLPIYTAAPLTERTGLRVLVGDRLHVLDVDTHSVTAVGGLPSDRYVVRVARAGGATYALLMPCTGALGTRTSVVRLRADGSAVVIASGRYSDLLGGGDHVWAVTYPDTSDGPIVLDPLDGTRPVRLPPGVAPIAGSGTMIAASSPIDDTSMELALFDPATSTVRTRIGAATAFGVSAGVVLWRGADCGPCALHLFDLATGARSQVPGTVGTRLLLWPAVISPDHRYAAMLRERDTPGQYEMGHPGNPNEVVVMDLTTGRVLPVPHLVLWAKANPGLTFSPDDRWLAIALDEGSGVRVLLWRPGLSASRELPGAVPGKVAFSPPLLAVP